MPVRLTDLGRDKGGNFAITAAILLPMLVMMTITTIDLGRMIQQGENLQDAADAAVLNLAANGSEDLTAEEIRRLALEFVTANMASDLRASVALECAGRLSDCANRPAPKEMLEDDADAAGMFYVEAKLTFDAFGNVIGTETLNRAGFAKQGGGQGSGPVCVLALSTSGRAFDFSGSAGINAPDCNVVSNSSDTKSIEMSGSSSIKSSCLQSAGGLGRSGSAYHQLSCEEALLNQAPVADPHLGLEIPNYSGSKDVSLSGSKTATIEAGTYKSITLAGSSSATLNPGIYYISDKISTSGTAKLTGENVVIVLMKNAQMSMSGSGGLTLKAPETGADPYAGFVIVQASDNKNPVKISGSAGLNLTGIVYAPAASIELSGSSGLSTTCLRYIGASVNMSGSASFKSPGDCQEELAGRDYFLDSSPLVLVR